MKEESKLDNPVLNSLNETHKAFSIDYNDIKFYSPEYCRFGGFTTENISLQGIIEYSKLVENFYVVGRKPNYLESLYLNKAVICNQMVLTERIGIPIEEEIVELKTEYQKSELFDLVNLVQPGYFVEKTSELGRYFGIYKKDGLIAVTGERMKMNAYTEISAVVTHPEYRRKGFAKQLINYVMKEVLKENKIPYLHVSEVNNGAINLYERLGFETRRKMTFWNLQVN